MNTIKDNWGFFAIGLAGLLCWTAIGWAMHRSSKVLAPQSTRIEPETPWSRP